MENCIREWQRDLFAGRASAATVRANQLRLWFASMAYALLCALRRIGLTHTQFADATCGTLRLVPLMVGAQPRRSLRRIKVAIASAHLYQAGFTLRPRTIDRRRSSVLWERLLTPLVCGLFLRVRVRSISSTAR